MLWSILARLYGIEDKYIYAYTFDGIISLHVTRKELTHMRLLKTIAGLFPGTYSMEFTKVIETIALSSSRHEVKDTLLSFEIDERTITIHSSGPEGGERIGPWETSLEAFPHVFVEDLLGNDHLVTHDPEAYMADEHMDAWTIATGGI